LKSAKHVTLCRLQIKFIRHKCSRQYNSPSIHTAAIAGQTGDSFPLISALPTKTKPKIKNKAIVIITDDIFFVVLCLILNIFYNCFYTIVQPPTLSDQEIIAKLWSTKHPTSIIRTLNTVTLQIFLLIPIPSIFNYRLFTIVFYILCAFLLL